MSSCSCSTDNSIYFNGKLFYHFPACKNSTLKMTCSLRLNLKTMKFIQCEEKKQYFYLNCVTSNAVGGNGTLTQCYMRFMQRVIYFCTIFNFLRNFFHFFFIFETCKLMFCEQMNAGNRFIYVPPYDVSPSLKNCFKFC